jgi:hypothetical protein
MPFREKIAKDFSRIEGLRFSNIKNQTEASLILFNLRKNKALQTPKNSGSGMFFPD